MKKTKAFGLLGLILSYVILLIATIVSLLPLAWIISTAIKTNVEVFATPPIWIPRAPTFANFMSVLLNSSIPIAFLNSFIIGIMVAFLALIFGGLAGYAFARFNFRGNRFLSLFMLLSQMLPVTVLMIPMFYMANDIGLVDTRIGISFAHLVIAMPLVTWMAKGYFSGVPKEIEEAAIIDGCNTFSVMVRVILPLVRPAIAATGIYAFVSSWNEFALSNVLTRTNASRTVPIALNEFSSFFRVDWGDTMAAATLITIPVIVVFMSIQRHFVQGLVSGAVKG